MSKGGGGEQKGFIGQMFDNIKQEMAKNKNLKVSGYDQQGSPSYTLKIYLT